EDGIGEGSVTGVQTCALPIYLDDDLLAEAKRIGIVEEHACLRPLDVGDERVAADRLGTEDLAQREGGHLDRADTAVRSHSRRDEIGRASCRERGEISVDVVYV